MSTRATVTVMRLATAWEDLYDTGQMSGVVGDLAHAQRGGYHISIEDQSNPDNYSVVRRDDKAPPGGWPRDCASAIDMNLGLADMKRCHGRLVTVWKNRTSDPRSEYINAHNGWNGDGAAGRYDWVTGSVVTATSDHKWHIHLEIRRRYVNDPKAAAAILSVLRGDTLDEFLEDKLTPDDKKWIAEQFGALPGKVWNDVTFGRNDNQRTAGAVLVEARTYAAATVGKVDDLDAQMDTYAADAAARDEDLPTKLRDALGTGQPPEQVAATLRAVLGDQADAVAQAILAGR